MKYHQVARDCVRILKKEKKKLNTCSGDNEV